MPAKTRSRLIPGLLLVAAVTLAACRHEGAGPAAPPPPPPPPVALDAAPDDGEAGTPARTAPPFELSEQPTELACGRLLARLPVGAGEQRTDCAQGDTAVDTLHRIGQSGGGAFAVATIDPLVRAEDDLEGQARRRFCDVAGEQGATARCTVSTVTDGKARVVRIVSDRLTRSAATVEGISSFTKAAGLLVAHPDGMVLLVELLCDAGEYECESRAQREALLALADMIAPTLEAGPTSIRTAAGARSAGPVTMSVPDGFSVRLQKGLDWSEFTVARFYEGKVGAQRLAVYFGQPAPEPVAKAYPGHTGRRALELAGRRVRFLRKNEAGQSSLVYGFPEGVGSSFEVTLAAEDGAPLAELEQIVESMEIDADSSFSQSWLHPESARLGFTCSLQVQGATSPLNIRAEPTAESAIVGTLVEGANVVQAGGRDRQWQRIRSPVEGWVWRPLLAWQCVE
jgi:hypothetical protein